MRRPFAISLCLMLIYHLVLHVATQKDSLPPLRNGIAPSNLRELGSYRPTQNGHNTHYASMMPDKKTLDTVKSPRNNNWFLLVLAARRGLTFLEQHPEVDATRPGVCGHSMSGNLTVDAAGIGSRVRAAVPSCGGAGLAPMQVTPMQDFEENIDRSELYLHTIDDRAFIPHLRCPILYLLPQRLSFRQ